LADYFRAYRQFTTSYYFSDGLRITAAVMIPVLVFSHFNQLAYGMAFVLGILFVNPADSPGPIHHRQNGMLATIILIFLSAFITGLAVVSPWLVAVEIVVFGFLFSMIGVYGVRANSIGLSTLFIMILTIDDRLKFREVLINALLIMLGGIWYYYWSVLLHRLRPYRLARQAIGDSIISIAEYFSIKASLYEAGVDYDKTFRALLEEQAQLHTKQNLVREILFKTRSIVRDSTHTGRVLVILFIDSVDIFESIMTSQRDYKMLHEIYPAQVLEKIRITLLRLADELSIIGVAVQEGRKSEMSPTTTNTLQDLEQFFEAYRRDHILRGDLEHLISLRHIVNSARDVYNRLEKLHRYTSFESNIKLTVTDTDYDRFVSPSNFNKNLLFENLNFDSNIFRFSIRVTAALLVAYLLSQFLPVGHGYWILLTVLVILKPAYSLTKERNWQRLGGTLAGAVIGTTILYFVKDSHALVIILVVFMIMAFSLMRLQYMLFVLFMTTYLLIAYHFLRPVSLRAVVVDRVIDTAIGSAVAFLLTLLIPPKWEQDEIRLLLEKTVEANRAYFSHVADLFRRHASVQRDYKYLRKEVYVALANLSDAFQRMLSEPASKQGNSVEIYQLVVANHLLASHIATLSGYLNNDFNSEDFNDLIESALLHLQHCTQLLQSPNDLHPDHSLESVKFRVREKLESLMDKRREEIALGQLETDTRKTLSLYKTVADQFEYIFKISTDMEKLVTRLNGEQNTDRAVA
jgi:uncharacterized membrane protein (TIGR01666 family)